MAAPQPLLASRALLERLTRLHPKRIDLSLARIERLLDRLGRPQERLPPVVHVAGTNGKGSTVAFLRAILEQAGLRLHVYTSPHLVRFTERIVIAGREIDDADLASILETCERANGEAPITFFEITTAAALLAFASTPADAVLLETGLGGRLDASNVVARPALTALTPISLDHQEFLGETLAAIAAEKAGILKAGVACVMAEQQPAAAAVVRARAASLGVLLAEQGRDWQAEATTDGWLYRDQHKVLTLADPVLPGAHQRQNAGAAIACARLLAGELALPAAGGESRPFAGRIDDGSITRGIAAAHWPARLQRLVAGPLAERLPVGWELWLDGGHNAGAAAALACHLAAWRDRPCVVVFGMLKTKDAAGFLALLAPHVTALAAVPIEGEAQPLAADEAAEIARGVGIPAFCAACLPAALDALTARIASPARLLICGSLYLAGQVLRENTDAARHDIG